MKENKFEKFIVNAIMAICLISMMLIGVRLFAKLILVNKLNMDSEALRVIADYTWGDLQEKQPKQEAENPTERLSELRTVYLDVSEAALLRQEEQTTVDNPSLYDKIVNKVRGIESNFETYAGEKFMGYLPLEKINECMDTLLGWEIVYARTDGTDYVLNTGSKYSSTEKSDMEEKVELVMDIEECVSASGAEFLYVQLPYKIDEASSQVPWGASAYENENADTLLLSLQNEGIATFDLRSALYETDWDNDSGFYMEDGHWTVNTALKATRLIAEKLNQSFDYQYNSDYFNEDNFECITYQTNNLSYPETVDILYPKYETDLEFIDAYRSIEFTGTFEDACIDQIMLADERSSVLTIYMANRIRNSYLAETINHMETSNPDKKILIISNSFGWYVASYLALDTEVVDYTYYYDDPDAIEQIVQELDPDLVMMIDF